MDDCCPERSVSTEAKLVLPSHLLLATQKGPMVCKYCIRVVVAWIFTKFFRMLPSVSVGRMYVIPNSALNFYSE